MENLKNLQLKITELMEDKSSLEKENAQLRWFTIVNRL